MEPIEEMEYSLVTQDTLVGKINEIITRVNYLTGFVLGMSDKLDRAEPSEIHEHT